MDLYCMSGIHNWAKQKETPKFYYYVCLKCEATKRRYKPGNRPVGLRHRRRGGGWVTIIKGANYGAG